VRTDANLAHAIGHLDRRRLLQCRPVCCGIKRIYVAASRYDEFVAGVVDLTQKYRLGSPLDPETSIGPVVRTSAAEAVRAQVRGRGGPRRASAHRRGRVRGLRPGNPYLAPQVLVDVDHSMAIMREETFGPAVGIMRSPPTRKRCG